MRKRRIALIVIALPVAIVAAAGFLLSDSPVDRPVFQMPVAGKLALTGVTVIDARTGGLSPSMNILLDRGKIVAVQPVSEPLDPVIRRIDATGKFVVPGYNDMHAHALNERDPSGELALMLANGITGFRQMSGSPELLAERRDSKLATHELSPALLVTPGAVLTPFNANDAAQAVATVREQQAQGADFIKIGLVSRATLYAVFAEARKLNLPVVGHVPQQVDVVAAALGGMRSIEHMGPSEGDLIACSSKRDVLRRELDAVPAMKLPVNLPFLEKLADYWLRGIVTNPVLAVTPAATRTFQIAADSFDEARCRRVARALIRAGNWQVPTLIRRKTSGLGDDPAFGRDPNLRYVAPETVKLWRDVTADYLKQIPPAGHAAQHAAYAADLKIVKLFDEEGVKMLAGSDSTGASWDIAGFALHQEFDELAKAGLSPLRILQMTTINGAEFLGRSSTMGTVAPGMNADLVLLDANPLSDVRNLHRIYGVVRAGFYHSRADLNALLQRVEAGQGVLK